MAKASMMGTRKAVILMNRLPEATRAELKKAIQKGADEFATTLRLTAPEVSRNLRSTIQKVPGGVGRNGDQELTVAVTIGGKVPGVKRVTYAQHLEYGTRKMNAQPFFFPPWRILRKRTISRVSRALSKGVKLAIS